MKIVPSPHFQSTFLLPKYWLIWLGFGALALLVNILPFSVIKTLGYKLGLVSMRIFKKRFDIAKVNLTLCFPNYSDEECLSMARKSFEYAGMAVFEMGMAWFWPQWRIRKISSVIGKEKLLDRREPDRGVLVLCSHHYNLEMTAQIFSQFVKGYGVYRPHSNPVYEFIQHRGRTRNGHKMIDRKDIKSMIKVLKKGHELWYLPDHDYGNRNSVFAPFFDVEKAATTAGTSMLIDASHCAVISGVTVRKGNQYKLYIGDDLSGEIERRNPIQAATTVNREIEKMIMRDVPAWMWLHLRFKTRPKNEESLYV